MDANSGRARWEMGWQYTVLVLPTLFAMSTAVLLGTYSLRHMQARKQSPELVTFFAVNVGLALWTGFAALKLLQTDPALKLLSYRFLYFDVAPLGALAFPFTLPHTDRISRITPGLVAAIMTMSAVFPAVLFASPDGLAVEVTRLVETNGLIVLRVNISLGHVVLQLLYNVVLSALAIVLILYEATRLGRTYIPQAVLVSVGLAAPFVFVACSSLRIPPFNSDGVNFVPTSATVTSAAIGIALFCYRFLDLSPIVYTTAMEESPDGVFVLDADKWIVHVNTRGAALLERFGAAVDDPVTATSPDLDLTTKQNDSIETTREDGEAVYLGARSQRPEWGDQAVRWVIVLRDVTELHHQRQTILSQDEKLTLLNQIVRHDIRSDMAVVLGNAQLAEESVNDKALRERLDTITRNDEHATELTVNIRNLMATILDDEKTDRPTTLVGPLWAEVSAVRDGMSEAAALLPGEPLDVIVVAGDMLRTVLRNLLTNAVRHNDVGRAEIDVSVEVCDDDALVRIVDSGPGIPDDRKEAVFGRGKKGFESPDTGLGLYLVDTIVSGYGGDVWVENNEPRGAVFVVRLRKAWERDDHTPKYSKSQHVDRKAIPSTVLPAGVSRWRVAVLTAVAAILVGLATLTDEPVGPVFATMGLLTLVCMTAGTVDTVREYPALPLVSAVYTTFLFASGYVSGASSNLLWAVLAVFSAFGAVVEAYNYRHGTSYLRLDFERRDRARPLFQGR